MSNSSLVNYTRISPNSTNPRKDKIKKITIHHMAGNWSVETCGNGFASASRKASSNYGIDSNGRVGMYVEEKNRAWTSGNADNDNQAITIEVANDVVGGNWHVSDKALAKLIDLCVDICKRNDIEELIFTGDARGNLTMHRYFQATACPGEYLASKFPYIASEVNKRLKPTPNYVGYLDSATSTSASGWAWNSIDDTALKVEIKAYKDGKFVRTFATNADVYRTDLKSAGKGNGKHGFNTKLDFNGLGYGTFTLKAFANGVQLTNTKTVTIEAPKATVTPKPSVNVSASNSTSTYTVVYGDSYWAIAKKLGNANRFQEIQKLNNNKPLYAGHTILVPSDMKKASSTSNSTTTTLKDGDRIKLESGATYVNGKSIPLWIRVLPLYYRGKNADGIIFSTQKTGAITGVVKANMVKKV